MDTQNNYGWYGSAYDDGGDQGTTGFGWNLFLFAVAITMIAVNWGFLRPASRQLEAMKLQVSTLERTVHALSKQLGSAHKAMNLLDVLASQGKVCEGASDNLSRIADLHDRLVKEASGLEAAHRAIADFSSIRDQLERNSELIEDAVGALAKSNQLHERMLTTAGEAEEAETGLNQLSSLRTQLLQVLRSMEDTEPLVGEFDKLQNRLLNMAPITKQATIVADELLSLNETLAYDMSLIEPAKTTLNHMRQIQETLNGEAASVEESHLALDNLVELKNNVISSSVDTPKAIEALEQTVDLNEQFVEAARSLEQIRRWMGDVIMMEPTIQRALRTLEPITQLGTLRRISHRELEYAAQMVRSLRGQTEPASQNGDELPEMAAKPDSDSGPGKQ